MFSPLLSALLLASLWTFPSAVTADERDLEGPAIEAAASTPAQYPHLAQAVDLLVLLGREGAGHDTRTLRLGDTDHPDGCEAAARQSSTPAGDAGDVVHSFRSRGERLLHYATAPPIRR